MQRRYAFALSRSCYGGNGEGGIRTLGSLLGYGALAKRCFRPLSHLTKNRLREYREEMSIANTDLRRVLAISSRVAKVQLLTEMIANDQRGRGAQQSSQYHSAAACAANFAFERA